MTAASGTAAGVTPLRGSVFPGRWGGRSLPRLLADTAGTRDTTAAQEEGRGPLRDRPPGASPPRPSRRPPPTGPWSLETVGRGPERGAVSGGLGPGARGCGPGVAAVTRQVGPAWGAGPGLRAPAPGRRCASTGQVSSPVWLELAFPGPPSPAPQGLGVGLGPWLSVGPGGLAAALALSLEMLPWGHWPEQAQGSWAGASSSPRALEGVAGAEGARAVPRLPGVGGVLSSTGTRTAGLPAAGAAPHTVLHARPLRRPWWGHRSPHRPPSTVT